MIPRVAGSLVQHQPNILHGVTSVTEGERKSLFIVDVNNGLGAGGVVQLTSDHIDSFLTDINSGSGIDSSSSSGKDDSSEDESSDGSGSSPGGDDAQKEEDGSEEESPPQKQQKTADDNQDTEGESSPNGSGR